MSGRWSSPRTFGGSGSSRPHIEIPPGVPYAVEGSRGYLRALARARYVVNNVNMPNFARKRTGATHLMTHHGTPLKTMGMDHYEYPLAAQGGDLKAMLARCDRWDFSVSTSPFNTEIWQRAYPCQHETLEFGYPRNDRLDRATPAEVIKARAVLGLAGAKKIILYAPTLREYRPRGVAPLDVERLADELGRDVHVMTRTHYLNATSTNTGQPRATEHPRVSDVSAYPCVEDLYLAADVLITDYSSAMFDFAHLDRPIVIFAPDWEAYRDARGVTFDLLAFPPGLVARDQDELAKAFANGLVDDDAATAQRAAFRDRFCPHRDGLAAERVVRRVLLGETLPDEPTTRTAPHQVRHPDAEVPVTWPTSAGPDVC